MESEFKLLRTLCKSHSTQSSQAIKRPPGATKKCGEKVTDINLTWMSRDGTLMGSTGVPPGSGRTGRWNLHMTVMVQLTDQLSETHGNKKSQQFLIDKSVWLKCFLVFLNLEPPCHNWKPLNSPNSNLMVKYPQMERSYCALARTPN